MGAPEVVEAATRVYLRGEPIDMSALAAELKIGRATLYRWVGNREELLAAVLAASTRRTFESALASSHAEGAESAVDVMRRFMMSVLEAPALRALTEREPLLFVRLATMPGLIEEQAAASIRDMLEREENAGRLHLALPAGVLAEAIVRICDAHMYSRLLGRGEPQLETALRLVRLLLGAPAGDGTSGARTRTPVTA